MKTHLVSGGCGFVGRNMVKRLFKSTNDRIVFVDDLSVGTHPDTWIDEKAIKKVIYVPGKVLNIVAPPL